MYDIPDSKIPRFARGDKSCHSTYTYPLSIRSLKRLKTCHPDIQKLVIAVSQFHPCSVGSAWRSPQEQQAIFERGNSTKSGGMSKHNGTINGMPMSLAVDLYPIRGDTGKADWETMYQAYYFAGRVVAIGEMLFGKGYIRPGADWNSNFSTEDTTFRDALHFELSTPGHPSGRRYEYFT